MRRRSYYYVLAVAMILSLAGLVAWAVTLRNERRTAEIVAALRDGLRSDDIHKRADAARAIYELGPLAKDAAPELVSALKSAAARVTPEPAFLAGATQHFVLALWAIGKPAEAALLGLLNEEEESVRLSTVIGLHPSQSYVKRDQEKDTLAVNVLRKALCDKAASVRYHACSELAEFKEVAKVALPELLELQDKDPDNRIRDIAKIATEWIKR